MFNLINEKLLLIIGHNFAFFILLFGIIILSFLLHKMCSQIFGKYYYYFLIPGIVVHELSHLFACLLTGAKVHKVKLFSKEGGFVKHSESKIPIIGDIVISFAPIIGGIASVFIIHFLLNFPAVMINYNIVELLNLIQTWQFWLGFYLIASIFTSLTPSSQDVKNSFASLFVVLIIFLILEYFEINAFSLLNHQVLINILSFGVIMQIFTLLLSVPFYFLKIIITTLRK